MVIIRTNSEENFEDSCISKILDYREEMNKTIANIKHIGVFKIIDLELSDNFFKNLEYQQLSRLANLKKLLSSANSELPEIQNQL